MRLPKAKADPRCSCVTGQYECWNCRKPELEEIERRLTPAQREYDRLALAGWRNDDGYDGREPECCSCHISTPCGYCLSHCPVCEEHERDCTCENSALQSEVSHDRT